MNKGSSRQDAAHLISFNFGYQVLEGRQAAEADHGLALLRGQTFDLGQRRSCQDDLLSTQEVLELCVVRRLTETKQR